MKKSLLIAGGLFLIGGSLAYYLLSQQNGFKCSNFTNQSQCEGNGCYWCPPGYCSNTPCGQSPCQGMQYCMYNGQLDCDQYNNRCICNAETGNWNLYEADSPICRSGMDYKYKCLPSSNNIVACVPTMEMVPLECKRPYYDDGCACNIYDCSELSFCDTRVHRCVPYGSENLSLTRENADSCYNTTGCGWNGGGQTCEYNLDDEKAFSFIDGEFGWKWGSISAGARLDVQGYLEGVGWTTLATEHWTCWSGEGSFHITKNFAMQGLSKIRFRMCAGYWTNITIDYFNGTLQGI